MHFVFETVQCSPAGIYLCRAANGDAMAIATISAACSATPWQEARICQELTNDYSLIAVAGPTGHAVAGYIFARLAADELEIIDLAVSPGERRKGVGSALVGSALGAVQPRSAFTAYLEVRCGNAPAIRLYEQCGFITTYTRKRYYADTQEDALVMSLSRVQHSGGRT
jgi:[ribosomal protein S18]-alanine N-acetyltransferase